MEVSLDAFNKRYLYEADSDLLDKNDLLKIYKAWDTEQEKHIAIQIYPVDSTYNYSLTNEVMRAKKMKHANLIEYFENYEINTPFNGENGKQIQYQIATLEYTDKGTLADLLKERRLSQSEIKILTQNLIEGLACLHANNIVHRHFNPRNIFVFTDGDKLTFKINYFGIICDEVKSDSASISNKELVYCAPEFFSRVTSSKDQITSAADVWSMAIILLQALNNEPVLSSVEEDLSKEEVINNILFKDIDQLIERQLPPFKEIIEKCLIRNPQTRPASAVILKEAFADFLASEKPKSKKSLLIADGHTITNVPVTPPTTEVKPVAEKAKEKKQHLMVDTGNEPDPSFYETEKKKVPWLIQNLRNKYIVGSVLGIIAVIIILIIYFAVSSTLNKNTVKNEQDVATSQPEAQTIKNEVAPDNTANTNVTTQQSETNSPSVNTTSAQPYKPTERLKGVIIDKKTNSATEEAQVVNPTKGDVKFYCFITLSVYHKSAEGAEVNKEVPAKGKGKKIDARSSYHFWSDVIEITCDKKDLKERLIKFTKEEFPATRDYFDGFKDVRAQVYPTLAIANKAQIPFRDDSKYPDGNYNFQLVDADVNSKVCK